MVWITNQLDNALSNISGVVSLTVFHQYNFFFFFDRANTNDFHHKGSAQVVILNMRKWVQAQNNIRKSIGKMLLMQINST